MIQQTHIRISTESKKKLDDLCKKFDVNNVSFINNCIDYFVETDINPSERFKSFGHELSSLRKELKVENKDLRDTFVSFIRELEKKRIDVLTKDVQNLAELTVGYIKNEALRKVDLNSFKETIINAVKEKDRIKEKDSNVHSESIVPKKDIDDKDLKEQQELYDMRKKRMQYLFEEFLKTGQRASFGGKLSFEDKTIEEYKKLFKQL